jgi:CBS domain-containing protein
MTETTDINLDELTRLEPFSRLDRETWNAVLSTGRYHAWRSGEYLYRAGEPYQERVHLLVQGRVELRRANGEVERVGPGSVLGLANYLDGQPHATTAVALEGCTVLELDAAELRELERRHPPLFDAFNHIIAERIRERSIAPRASTGALAQPVRAVMKAPLATCGPDISLAGALKTMRERKIGSLGVRRKNGELLGILTCSGLSEALALKGAAPESSVMQAACETPRTIAPAAPLWQAEEMLQRHGVKYVVVVEDGAPVGMISQTDILHALIRSRSRAVNRALEATGLETLSRLYADLHEVAAEAQDSNRLPSRAVGALTDVHLAIQRRCVELTLQKRAPAPRAYAVLIMGSGGRGEMLLDPDQDNGLIITDAGGKLTQAEQRWFMDFATDLNRNLAEIGYALCRGDIMARNPLFNKTLAQWQQQVSHLAAYPNQKAARWSNIVFDFDTLHGDSSLTTQLRRHVLTELHDNHALLEFMVEDDAEGRPPLGLFNRLLTGSAGEAKGKIDIKRNGLRLVADAARVYALSAGIRSGNTVERLHNLVRQGVLSADLVDSVTAAYEELLDLLLSHQIAQRRSGTRLDKFIGPEALSSRERDALRTSLRAVKRLQDQLQGRFGRAAF